MQDSANAFKFPNEDPINQKMTEPINLPPDLEHQALVRFDDLKANGELFYQPSEPERIHHRGFQVSGICSSDLLLIDLSVRIPYFWGHQEKTNPRRQ